MGLDMQLPAPAAENRPAVHRLQPLWPDEAKEPAEHAAHLELPGSAEAVPAAQGEQLDEPAREKEPAGQIMHAVLAEPE